MIETQELTSAQVAFVLREPIKAVKKALDEGPVRARLIHRAGGAVRTIDRSDLLYLYTARALRDHLTPRARNELHDALKRQRPHGVRDVRFGHLIVKIDDLEAQVAERLTALSNLAETVEFRDDGEPVFKGTTLEVHRIAALIAGGLTPEDILEDYPSLEPSALATARAYAAVFPKAGRPFPPTTAKRALRGAGLEALDEVMGAGYPEE